MRIVLTCRACGTTYPLDLPEGVVLGGESVTMALECCEDAAMGVGPDVCPRCRGQGRYERNPDGQTVRLLLDGQFLTSPAMQRASMVPVDVFRASVRAATTAERHASTTSVSRRFARRCGWWQAGISFRISFRKERTFRVEDVKIHARRNRNDSGNPVGAAGFEPVTP